VNPGEKKSGPEIGQLWERGGGDNFCPAKGEKIKKKTKGKKKKSRGLKKARYVVNDNRYL